MFKNVIDFVQSTYGTSSAIPLHEPKFIGNEKQYLTKCIDSTFVSSVGQFVEEFEQEIAIYTGAKYAVATTNGTSALHIALLLANVENNNEVITQALSFVATSNAINYCNAWPVFVDVDKETMGMSPKSLQSFLENETTIKDNNCINNSTGRVIKACVPMHTFGHPCKVDEIRKICDKYHLFLIEDAAESVGSFFKGKHTGTFGQIGIMSFNGNKIITAGGGGCFITNDKSIAIKAKHLTTTAKEDHDWKFSHDMIGYNYRMPNLNAALLVAQMQSLENFLDRKRKLANIYEEFFKDNHYNFFKEPKNSHSNYWLNSIILKDKKERDIFLEEANINGVMVRPIWTLMNKLTMFKNSQCTNLKNSEWFEERVVNLPSSVIT